ncbi:MAG: beta-ketoacyl-ACP synthase III [Syntrophobacteraceae bacterium]|nr:ketoacyl-ACP synthase III [Desulfobacteraceae bacterium]
MVRSVITGTGRYVPPRVVSNAELAGLMDTSDEWIRTRTGIIERRFADEGVSSSDLGLEAARRAIEDAGLQPSDMDLIIFATLSPDHHFPGSGCYLQAKLGVPPIGCLDVRNQCTGFLYSLSVADAFIRSGVYKNILVVGAEVHSSALDMTDRGRDIAVLFGDGAGAAVVSACKEDGRGIIHSELHADGRFARALYMDVWDISRKPFMGHESVDSGEIYPKMDGKTVFKHAVTNMIQLFQHTLEVTGTNPADIKYVIPHQANMRINQAIAERLGIPEEKFLHNIQRYANTTAASIPILLDETRRSGKIEKGDLILLIAFGSGFTWASTLLRW